MRTQKWVYEQAQNGAKVFIPDTCIYEVERELIRVNASSGLARLQIILEDQEIEVLTVDSELLYRASVLWASLRNEGIVLSHEKALDFDILICLLSEYVENAVVLTTNVKHFEKVVKAMDVPKL